jgi:glyceraldehyde-3-phosphate dehydrogenase/erythrose-4-phosphate dehydrogenase
MQRNRDYVQAAYNAHGQISCATDCLTPLSLVIRRQMHIQTLSSELMEWNVCSPRVA